MNDHIPAELKDAVYYYARKVVRDAEEGRWELHVDPDDCLVALNEDVNDHFDRDFPTLETVEAEPVTHRVEDDSEVLEGRILLGGGVIPIVDDALVLIFRDAGAPAAPLRWTAADGRVDATLTRTTFGEFYEELLVFQDGTPVYVDVPEAPDMRETYAEALEANEFEVPDPLPTLQGAVPETYRAAYDPVVTHFGDQRYESEFWVNWDIDAGHFGVNQAIAFDGPDLTFADGELCRCVERFPLEMAAERPSDSYVDSVSRFIETFA
ncbi:MAG: hypothetical protein ACI8U4_002207 [Natronomonas sp.]|jgi:hypothetical protein